MTIQHNFPGAAVARRAVADGILTNGEYDAVIAVWDAQKRAMCAEAKRSIRLAALGKLSAGKSLQVDAACEWGHLATEDNTVFAMPLDGGKWEYLVGGPVPKADAR
jgi:hypothetical protein